MKNENEIVLNDWVFVVNQNRFVWIILRAAARSQLTANLKRCSLSIFLEFFMLFAELL